MKKYIILSVWSDNDFGSASLVNEDIWNFITHHDIELLSHETLEEIKNLLNNPSSDDLINELNLLQSFQNFHCFISNLNRNKKKPSFGISFYNLTELVNYCIKNNIEISGDSFDD